MENKNNEPELRQFEDLAVAAAHAGGQLLASKLGNVEIREKNPADFVTSADLESQRIIQEMIDNRFPAHHFLGEESDEEQAVANAEKHEYCWIVDPLDGTTNYIHELRSFSVSIALRYRDEMIAGCVYDPILKETFRATKGGGAFLNDQPIRPSRQTKTKDSLIVCSLPGKLTRDSWQLEQLLNVLCESDGTIRRLGSTALNLCFIACGRVDAYWSTKANIWDIAAGALILEEAGAVMKHISGEAIDYSDIKFIASATNDLNDRMRDLLRVPQV